MDKTNVSVVAGATLLAALAGCSLFEPSVEVHSALTINGQSVGGADEQFEQGRKLLAEGRYGAAAQAFQAALVAGPPTVERLNGLAVAYDHLGRFDLSDQYYRQALSLDARNSQTLNNLGVSFARRGMPERAALVLAEAAGLEPKNETVAANLVTARADSVRVAKKTAETRDKPVEVPVADSPAVPRVERVGINTLELVTEASNEPPTPMAEVVPPRHPIVSIEVASAPAAVSPAVPAPTISGPAPAPAYKVPEAVPEIAGAQAPRSTASARVPGIATASAARSTGAAVAPRAVHRPAVVRAKPPRIEVANGAGRTRMAARMRSYLSGRGVSVARLTNDRSFANESTVIYYRPGFEDAARELSQSLPVSVEAVMSETLGSDVRIRLGRDLMAFDTGLKNVGRKNDA